MKTPVIEASEQGRVRISLPNELARTNYRRCVTRPYDKYEEQLECFSLRLDKKGWFLSSSYFIGIDWLDEGMTALRILPKFNQASTNMQVDYLSMLHEALIEPQNIDKLEGLLYVDFDRPYIEIPNQDGNILSLFLVTEYVHVLEVITRKGLKKSYYQVEGNVSSKIKGKLLFAQNIQKNHAKGDFSKNYCRHQEYGVDIPENQLLKKALIEASHIIENYTSPSVKTGNLVNILGTILPKWRGVSAPSEIKPISEGNTNTFFKEYTLAIRLAKLILKQASVNQVNNESKTTSTPPYWIDMSKLFEMYVLKLMRQRFNDSVEYHPPRYYNDQEPDYLLHADKDRPAYIVDAKYKRYSEKEVWLPDIRQVSGYARLDEIRRDLMVQGDDLIRCAIIYPDMRAKEELPPDTDWEKEGHYKGIYKVGVRLPVIDSASNQ